MLWVSCDRNVLPTSSKKNAAKKLRSPGEARRSRHPHVGNERVFLDLNQCSLFLGFCAQTLVLGGPIGGLVSNPASLTTHTPLN